jgi:DNA modification methylase
MKLLHGNNLDLLRAMPDNSVHAIVCDPPYGLGKEPDALAMLRDWVETGHHDVKSKSGFMGKTWDNFVPQPVQWRECYRVLKPGGHLLSFAGTRTQDLVALGLRLAGFEIRDLVAWVYGCLSEDTEVLTDQGWMLYHTGIQNKVLAYDVENDLYQWEKPERWSEYRVESDTAYHIVSDSTNQIVSRGHRCLVERGGKLVFVSADKLFGVERMPTLSDSFCGIPEGQTEVLQPPVQRILPGTVMGNVWGQRIGCGDPRGQSGSNPKNDRPEEPRMEGRSDLLQTEGQVCESGDQVCPVPAGVSGNGAEGWLRDAAQIDRGDETGATIDPHGMRPPHQPRCDGQSVGEPDAIRQQCGSQETRTRTSYRTSLATVTPITYKGVMWCPTVSTGAFVARRRGRVFVTGNSGFPKSLDVGKALDKMAGAERKILGPNTSRHGGGTGSLPGGGIKADTGNITAPATEAAQQWDGWGTALKPALEPITLARKPLEGTVAANVLKWHTGALNVDGCRVGAEGGTAKGSRPEGKGRGIYGAGLHGACEITQLDKGRWPANLIHDGSDDVTGMFPDTKSGKAAAGGHKRTAENMAKGSDVYGGGKGISGTSSTDEAGTLYGDSGSAARFFYAAKVSAKERNEGLEHLPDHDWQGDGAAVPERENRPFNPSKNHHPTVKPIALMRYLCRLITPPGGTVLDPWMGSGSTGKAAALEGFDFIGMEQDAEYFRIAQARCGVKEETFDEEGFWG